MSMFERPGLPSATPGRRIVHIARQHSSIQEGGIVPVEQHSSYDRGFDLGHADIPPTRSPVLGRTIEPRAPTGAPWKKVLAMAMVAIMVGAAFVMLMPAMNQSATPPVKKEPAYTQAPPGAREVTYSISHMGEAYMKDSSDKDGARGVCNSTPGLNTWWEKRKAAYSDTIVHNAFPYVIAYQGESGANGYGGTGKDPVYHLPYGTYSFYRFAFDAKNLSQSNLATGANKDPLFLPILGKLSDDGGNVQINWHLTYFTDADVAAMLAGTSYVNSYYGVSPSVFNFGGLFVNEGWYLEHSGKMVFDRNAAKKFLNLGLATDLRTQFLTNNTALNLSWGNHYLSDGGPDALYDIKACYDSSINTGPVDQVNYYLKLEPENSTQDVLTVRMWGYSWGFEYLLMRYLDVQGLITTFQPSIEEWFFNATIGPNLADIQSRSTAVYHMQTWKDGNAWIPSWLIEPQHADYNDYVGASYPDPPYWFSRFAYYSAYSGYVPLRQQWMPGTNAPNNPGTSDAYWATPTAWDLALYEKLTVKLSDVPFLGYDVYNGTVSDIFPKNGGGNDLKVAELNTHKVWGELVLGHGYPSELYSTTYYDPLTKTITINGPKVWVQNRNTPDFPDLNLTGTPQLMLDVSKVSQYNLTMLEPGPYTNGLTYHLVVTAKNITGATVTDWTGTVNLAPSAGITLGATLHKYIVGDSGVWTVTIVFTTAGSKTITSTDSILPLDLVYVLTFNTLIPEFPSILIPVMMGAAMIVVFIRRMDKKREN